MTSYLLFGFGRGAGFGIGKGTGTGTGAGAGREPILGGQVGIVGIVIFLYLW